MIPPITPDTERLLAITERERKATKGPWKGCNHVEDHAFDSQCKCGAAFIWDTGADTIVCDQYNNSDGSGPEPMHRDRVLSNMSFIAHSRQDIPYLLQTIQALQEDNQRLAKSGILAADLAGDTGIRHKAEFKRREQLEAALEKARETIDEANNSFKHQSHGCDTSPCEWCKKHNEAMAEMMTKSLSDLNALLPPSK